MQPTILPDGRIQHFYFPDDNPHYPGYFKGMQVILQEHGLWPEDQTLLAQCDGFKCVMEQPLVLSHLILSTLQFDCVMEQPLSPLSYLFDLINYASLILLNKLSILFHPIIVWPCGRYYKVQGWAHV